MGRMLVRHVPGIVSSAHESLEPDHVYQRQRTHLYSASNLDLQDDTQADEHLWLVVRSQPSFHHLGQCEHLFQLLDVRIHATRLACGMPRPQSGAGHGRVQGGQREDLKASI